ncbi:MULTISPECIES: ABC transporter permease [unclassified Rhodococcus (in: high G+C Gram-positive bacteria)]|uniref:ABC transporter permease n=1 Tax=Rhodococcus sp. SJ-3 TaxID=3454628 RepID=UPI003F78F116
MVDDPLELIRTLVGVTALASVATAVLWAFGVPHRFAPVYAIARGTVQLAFVALVLTGVIADARWVALVLVIMFGVALWTASRRVGRGIGTTVMVGVAMFFGIGTALVIVFVSGAIELTPRYALALGGIVIGGGMTVAGLAGRRFTEIVDDRWTEVEGWLALGATMRQATLGHARLAVRAALIPSLDQTKTTGLVTLPGAFVGAIFGGLSPLEAGRFQVVVLAAIMAAGSITAVVLAIGLGRLRVRPVVQE